MEAGRGQKPRDGVLRPKVVSVLVSVGFGFRCGILRERARRELQQTRVNAGILRYPAFWCGIVLNAYFLP